MFHTLPFTQKCGARLISYPYLTSLSLEMAVAGLGTKFVHDYFVCFYLQSNCERWFYLVHCLVFPNLLQYTSEKKQYPITFAMRLRDIC